MTSVLLRTQSDDRLVALAREGHERAFEAIVERYRRSLLRACRRVLPEARAEDALQQALVAAWRGLRRGDEVRELRAWLHRIAHNTSLNQLRQSGYDYDELEDSLRIADAADDELERRAVVRQTLAGLANLPERQREALLAIAVAGRSQDEVAHDLGLSQGAVRQLVHRARTSLRAAATAITPLPLVAWLAAATTRGEPLAQRLAELSAGAGGAGAATALAKAGAAAVLAGGAITGPALVERTGGDDRASSAGTAQASDRGDRARQTKAAAAAPAAVVTAPVAASVEPMATPRRLGGESGEARRGQRGGGGSSDDDGNGERGDGTRDGEERGGGRSDGEGDGVTRDGDDRRGGARSGGDGADGRRGGGRSGGDDDDRRGGGRSGGGGGGGGGGERDEGTSGGRDEPAERDDDRSGPGGDLDERSGESSGDRGPLGEHDDADGVPQAPSSDPSPQGEDLDEPDADDLTGTPPTGGGDEPESPGDD